MRTSIRPESVQIDELVLRLPAMAGVDRERARELAREVADRLADALSTHGHRIGSVPTDLALRVRLPDGTPRADVARVIAAQILEALS